MNRKIIKLAVQNKLADSVECQEAQRRLAIIRRDKSSM